MAQLIIKGVRATFLLSMLGKANVNEKHVPVPHSTREEGLHYPLSHLSWLFALQNHWLYVSLPSIAENIQKSTILSLFKEENGKKPHNDKLMR